MSDTRNHPDTHEGDDQITDLTHAHQDKVVSKTPDQGDQDAPFTGHPASPEPSVGSKSFNEAAIDDAKAVEDDSELPGLVSEDVGGGGAEIGSVL